MRYMFLIYCDEPKSLARSVAETQAGMAAHTPYIEMLRRNGHYVGGDPLGPARSARTLRTAGGKPVETDGPFAESCEQLGGYYFIEARDLDLAIDLARKCPAFETVGVGIEIRPIPAVVAEDAGDASDSRYLFAMYGDEGPRAPLVQPLAPAGSATTLRLSEGKVVLVDGPFAENREPLTAYRVAPARDMRAAVQLAFACIDPRLAAIEVRPIRGTGAP
jgi:hypothetical protein